MAEAQIYDGDAVLLSVPIYPLQGENYVGGERRRANYGFATHLTYHDGGYLHGDNIGGRGNTGEFVAGAGGDAGHMRAVIAAQFYCAWLGGTDADFLPITGRANGM